MNPKIFRCTGKVLIPIVTAGIVFGSIHFEYPSEVPHWRKVTLYHPHEHVELSRYNQPKLNIIVSGTTASFTRSTATTS